MLIKLKHWSINLRQQSRLSLIDSWKFPQLNLNQHHFCKISMTATQQAIGKGQ